MAWDLSCPDWEQRLRDGRSLVPDLPLDLVQGNRAVAVFDKLKLADVPGTPRLGPVLPTDPPDQEGDAAGEWFRDILRALAGSWDQATKERFIREVFCLVPKKNSKTSYAALLMLTFLLLNLRPRAPFILFGPVQDTADLAFSQAAGAIALDPVLEKKLHVREHLKTIVHRETKAELEIMTFDPAVATGKKPVGTLIDEVHVIAKNAKAASALRQIRGGMLPFPEAFLVMITTQSEEAPVGIMKSELKVARDVRDGKLKTPTLPVLYEFPEAMQKDKARPWRDPANWHMVTPNAGRSITVPRLAAECEVAETKGEAELRAWASQHLNIEIGLALRSDAWAGAEFWEQQAGTGITLEHLLAVCDVLEIGVDGGGLDDLLGLTVLGRHAETGDWLHWARAYAHVSVLERRKSEAPLLLDLHAAGHLVLCDEFGQDVVLVGDIVAQCEESGLLDKIGVDPSGIGSIVDEITGRGIELERIVGVSQGWRLVGAIKTAERKLSEKKLVHEGSPLMAWCVGNAKVVPSGNAVLITKQASGTGKIDPLMSTFNAVELMSRNPQGQRSYWDHD